MNFRLKDNNDKENGGLPYQDIRMIKCENNSESNQDLLYCKRKTTNGEEVIWRRDRIVYFNVPSYANITVLSGDSNTNDYHKDINTKNNQTVVDATDASITTTKGYYFYQYESNTLKIQISYNGQYYIPLDGVACSVDKFDINYSDYVDLIDNTKIYKTITITLKSNQKILEDITITVTPQPYYYINIKSNSSRISGTLTYFNESNSLKTFKYNAYNSYKKYFVKPLNVSGLNFYSSTKGQNTTVNSKIKDRDLNRPDDEWDDKYAITGWFLKQDGSIATPSVTSISYSNFKADDSPDTYYIYLLTNKYYSVIWNQGKIDKNTDFEVSTVKVYSTEIINPTNQRDNTSVVLFPFNFEEKTNGTVVSYLYNSTHARYKVYTNEDRSGKTLSFEPTNWESVKNQYNAGVYSIESTKVYNYPKVITSEFEDVYDAHASRKRYSFSAKVYNYNYYPDAYFYNTPSEIYHGDKFKITSNENNANAEFSILKFWDNNQARSTFFLEKGHTTGYTRKASFNLSNNEELTSDTILYTTINQTINSYPVYFSYGEGIAFAGTNKTGKNSDTLYPNGSKYNYNSRVYWIVRSKGYYYVDDDSFQYCGWSGGNKIYTKFITMSDSSYDFGSISATAYNSELSQVTISYSYEKNSYGMPIFSRVEFTNQIRYSSGAPSTSNPSGVYTSEVYEPTIYIRINYSPYGSGVLTGDRFYALDETTVYGSGTIHASASWTEGDFTSTCGIRTSYGQIISRISADTPEKLAQAINDKIPQTGTPVTLELLMFYKQTHSGLHPVGTIDVYQGAYDNTISVQEGNGQYVVNGSTRDVLKNVSGAGKSNEMLRFKILL